MRYSFFALLSSIMFACCPEHKDGNTLKEMLYSEADRGLYLNQLLEEMHSELYNSRFYQVNISDRIISCGGCSERRNKLNIRQNSNGKIVIGEDLCHNVTESITKHFTANMDTNNVTNNRPMYSRLAFPEVEENHNSARVSRKSVEEIPGASEDIIAFKMEQEEEWKQLLKVFDVLDTSVISQPHYQAKISIDYQVEDIGKSIVDSALIAFYELRDIVSKRYTGESYLKIYIRYQLHKSEEDLEKLDAIKLLMPLVIVDKPYCRKNDIWLGEVAAPLPPIEIPLIEL